VGFFASGMKERLHTALKAIKMSHKLKQMYSAFKQNFIGVPRHSQSVQQK
jgi:hypothetical protein